MLFLYLFVAFLLLGCVPLAVPAVRRPGIFGVAAVCGMALTALAVAVQWLAADGPSIRLAEFAHSMFGATAVTADGVTAWFIIPVSVIFIAGAFYGQSYLSHYTVKTIQLRLHWASLAVTFAGMMVLFTTDNLIVFLVGWEMMAIGSFVAVIFENDKPLVLKAGLNYFIQSHIAVLLITVAFCWVYSRTGRLDFGAFGQFMSSATDAEAYTIMMMLVAGFGFKAGIIPLHTWLPLAHPAAPSHVSALMSGVIVKAGVYGVLRFGGYLATCQTAVGVTLLCVGVLSGLFGIVNAAVHRDFKRMLAYCTIENIGIIFMGLGIGFVGWGCESQTLVYLGFGSAMLHTVNHALFKALLFFGAGNVYVSTHTRNMEELGGLIKAMPQTAVLFLVGSLAVGGLPPFGGFVSELMAYIGFLKGMSLDGLALPVLMILSGGALAIIGGVSMLAFTKSFGVIFLGTPRAVLHSVPREAGTAMLAPAYALLLPILLVMIFPDHLIGLAAEIVNGHLALGDRPLSLPTVVRCCDVAGVVARGGLVFLLVVAAVVVLRSIAGIGKPVSIGPTWGCGYAKPIDHIQYSSKSFANTLIGLFRIFLPSSSRFNSLTTEEIFPQERGHMSVDSDLFDKRMAQPLTGGVLRFLNRFNFIQNGNLQRYIVYGLAYTLLLTALAVLF